jgi:hypothetical protein
MAKQIRAFNLPLEKFAKALNLNLRTVVQRVALDAYTRITLRTPVDTGRARSSWQLSVKNPSGAVPPPGTYAAPGPPDVSGITGEEEVWIASNLDYILPLEQGHSGQAPSGMVMITAAEISAEIEQYLAKLENTQ